MNTCVIHNKQPPVDDKTLLDDLTFDSELPTQMDLDINDARMESATTEWKKS
jgi:hypothetical protein